MANRTVGDIYELASALIFEASGEDTDSQTFSIPFLNIFLQECLPTENSIREFNGDDLLTEAPWVESLDDEVAYNGSLTRVALPYALAWRFFVEAMDTYQADICRAKYDEARNNAGKCIVEDIEDYYATAEE